MNDIHQIAIDDIRIANPRSRNEAVFQGIVANIQALGLKKPITVCRRLPGETPLYDLVCGQGRLEAFRALGERTIPAIVIEANPETRFLMSLVENVARRQPSNLELLREIANLKSRGYSTEEIARKLDYHSTYVKDIAHLLSKGEERLIEFVATGRMPLSVAVKIASGTDAEVQQALCDAYDSGALRGGKLRAVRRLITKRLAQCASKEPCDGPKPRKLSADDLVREYQQHTAQQRALVFKANRTKEWLILLITTLKHLTADEQFTNILRNEGLDSMPARLAQRVRS